MTTPVGLSGVSSSGSMGVDRRKLIGRLAAGTVAMTVVPGAFGQGRPLAVGAPMATLSAYMAGAPERALPPEVVDKAKQHILDTIAAMVSGSTLKPGRAAIAFAR